MLAKCARVRTKVRNELPFTGHSYGATRAVFYHQYYKQYTPTELRQNDVVPKERPVCNKEESTRRSSVGAPCWGIAIIFHTQGHTSTLGDKHRVSTNEPSVGAMFSTTIQFKLNVVQPCGYSVNSVGTLLGYTYFYHEQRLLLHKVLPRKVWCATATMLGAHCDSNIIYVLLVLGNQLLGLFLLLPVCF